ncbi:hypothetical protein BS636_07840 [Acinetobacter sp. LoGeW2-3]|uniref:glycosyltransferase family 2 protein n=1 Tax=Acinetobacter sp. LoGeW2-3 TaxID=1808001 RepID=UPI000C059E51|nr:glycosyltransferase family 2 protein [Acinetobacter sp. LoGeW2-3]ATO19570.1 hypothetical protein BS636_07840 [Acinetobacter sp. LoGeW2-3]
MNILVSVCVVTYNQERFIEDNLRSLLAQKTNFSYEIVIGDDSSTDSTREIIERLYKEYSNIIVPIFHEKNIGPIGNIKSVYKKARGKYIYHLDGDDLALPNKLQRQFDIMELNPDGTICTHDMKYVNAQGDYLKSWTHFEGKFNLDYLYLNLPFFAHSSKMFRNDFKLEYLNELHPQALDIEIHIAQAKKGNIYHINEELGEYRVDVGISKIGKKINPILPKGLIRAYEKAIFEEKNEIRINELKRVYAKTMLQYARQFYLTNSDYEVFCMLVKKSLSIKFYTLRQLNYYLLMLLPRKIIYNRK